MCTASLLSLILRKIRQPKVIAEVLGGILLGVFNLLVLRFFSLNIYRPNRVWSRPWLHKTHLSIRIPSLS